MIVIIGNFLGIGQFKPKGQIITEHELWKKLESRKIKSVRYSKGGTRQMKSFSTYHNVEIQEIDDNFFKTKLYHMDMIYLIKQVPSQKVFHLNVIVLLFDILVPAQVIIFVVYILRQNNLLGGNMSGKTKISASQKSLFTFEDVA
ncbi:hypothetical protein [Rice orange leaf phytoplasma]|uniref:hypothetical protein n=1 Tax=Rice orange leaf phytoplasma TaxID=146897 RepID=UPI0008F57627|nr:hypothetical protein [Rice orange leaf phytoplasma]OIJ44956.1 hypothetical protein BHE82_00080 [Rice orange leaf phytoplasma]